MSARFEPDQPHEPGPEVARESPFTVKRVAGAVLLALLLTFLVQNGKSARMHFLGFSFTLPVGVALLVAAVAGGVATLLVTAARRRRLRAQQRHR
ncbi:MAG: LapA family protein [Actinobacteria bacterium]|nr:LapA family protein [Actinomycetota bacterium]